MSERDENKKSDLTDAMTSLIQGFKNIEQIPLMEMFERIKNGRYRHMISPVRRLVEQNRSADHIKKWLPAFTPCCTVENGFTTEHIVKYNGLMVIDFDKIPDDQYSAAFEKIKEIPYTYMAFKSPSGNGIKIIVSINSGFEDHSKAFDQTGSYYSDKLNLKLDISGKNTNRLCYVSYDPEAFLNLNCSVFEVKQEEQKTAAFASSDSECSNWKTAIRWTEKKYTYTNGERNNYIHYLACCCNRLGLDYEFVHDEILSNYQHENPDELIKSIKSAYNNHLEFNTVADFAKVAGFAKETYEEDLSENPYLPAGIFEQLPEILKKSTNAFQEQRQKDVFLTGALGVLSGCFNSLNGVYDGEQVYANLYSYISAPAASGKGALTHTRTIAMKYHDFIRSKSQANKVQSLLFIPGNSSSAAILSHLNENQGAGIFFETEADTISNSLKQEWGNFSDILRKAFHHEPVTSSRKMNNEYFQLDYPKLSVVLSGTPSQVQTLIQSAENGLFSRFLFYSYNSPASWRDVSPNRKVQNLKVFFQGIGEEVFEIVSNFQSYESIEFRLSDNQWKILNDVQSELLTEFTSEHGDDAASMVKRMGLMWFRIAMVLTALRTQNNISESEGLLCSDLDFGIAEKLMKAYKVHILSVYKSLPKQVQKMRNPNEEALYYKLPDQFNRKALVACAKDLNIGERTADSYRDKFQKQGLLEAVKFGVFRKVKQ